MPTSQANVSILSVACVYVWWQNAKDYGFYARAFVCEHFGKSLFAVQMEKLTYVDG